MAGEVNTLAFASSPSFWMVESPLSLVRVFKWSEYSFAGSGKWHWLIVTVVSLSGNRVMSYRDRDITYINTTFVGRKDFKCYHFLRSTSREAKNCI